MARTVSSDLQTILNLTDCETHTTLDLIPVTGSPKYFATGEFTHASKAYLPHLIEADEVKQAIFSTPDRVNVAIQNVDKGFGADVLSTGESMAFAEAILGRLYKGAGLTEWVELFRGQAYPVEDGVTEQEVRLEILQDLTAAGYCVGDWTLAPNCQFRFKHADTCGYSGGETLCNKRRFSKDGCQGRSNEHHFGGMEFPDVQGPATPTGGGGGGGNWPHPCFIGETTIWSEAALDVPIRDIQIGDWALCYDEHGIIHERKITDKKSHWVEEYMNFRLSNGVELGVTKEHLILDRSNGFTAAGRFRPGQLLTLFITEMQAARIESIEIIRGDVEVFSIEVEEFHTHFANRVAVHNSKLPEPPI